MHSKTFPVAERGIGAGGCVIIILVVLVILGVGGYFLFKGATGLVEEQVKTDLRDNPVVKEHLGNLTEVKLNLKATGAQSKGSEGQIMVFDATGSKANGELTVTLTEVGDQMKVTSGKLRTEDGNEHALFPGGAPPGGAPAGGGTPAGTGG